MRSAQIFRGFIGIFHYIQTSSVSGCYLPQRRLFFYSTKWILLLSKRSCCFLLSAGYPRAKKRKYLHILRKLQNIMDQRHTILKRCNSDPHAAKSQCIRFQPDILLCDRHIDLCHILNRQSPLSDIPERSQPVHLLHIRNREWLWKAPGSSPYLSQHKIPTAADYMRWAPAYPLSGSERSFPSLRVYLHYLRILTL